MLGRYQLFTIYLVMYLIPSAGLFHCVTGVCEIVYFVLEGGATFREALLLFEAPMVLGNTVGGVLFVALPNHFQTREERFWGWERLSWRAWLRGAARA